MATGFLILIITARVAYAVHWVEVPGQYLYIDTDSVVKQGDTLTFWILTDYSDDPPVYRGVVFKKSTAQYEVDMRVPHLRRMCLIRWDEHDKQIGAPYHPPAPWYDCTGSEIVKTALRYAKKGHDDMTTATVPALTPFPPVSDRY